MIFKFNEVLNDFINYFLLADIEYLCEWKNVKNLDNNLASEFTSNDSGNEVSEEGVMLPLNGIENYPYTIIFNFTDSLVLDEHNNTIQFKKEDNSLYLKSSLSLFTWPLLNNISDESIKAYLNFAQNHQYPTIKVEEGWYDVIIVGGESLQESGYEPTLEFMFNKVNDQTYDNTDVNYQYAIKASEY